MVTVKVVSLKIEMRFLRSCDLVLFRVNFVQIFHVYIIVVSCIILSTDYNGNH